ncbi:MAG: SUMF1/EgtB/PvdO family nonheme iron enzyme [bacterium]
MINLNKTMMLVAYVVFVFAWYQDVGAVPEPTKAQKTSTYHWDAAKAQALRLAIDDLSTTFGARYPQGPDYLKRLSQIERAVALAASDGVAAEAAARPFEALRAEALLANPLLDFDQLLLVKRADAKRFFKGLPWKEQVAKQNELLSQFKGILRNFVGNDLVGFLNGLPINYQGNNFLREVQFDNEIAVLSSIRPGGTLTTLYRPEKPVFVGDMKLHFDAGRLMFSSIGNNGRWQVFEINADGKGLRQVTRGDEPDVDNYDPCYLADDRVLFDSSIPFQSIPCEYGADEVGNLCVANADGSGLRRLCFDQDHNYYPSLMADGRILYLRWEYTDLAHAFTGRLMSMNPDGTGQRAHYASSGYWPNRIFYAKPIPGHPSKFVGIVSGHHGTARAGELIVFDVSRGRQEAQGAVQRIPGRGKTVEAKVVDNLVGGSWPKFLHPYPLSDKYFIASCQPTPQSLWGIYLVDTFDNMLLLREEKDCVLFEPVPIRKSFRPPVLPPRVKLASKEATVYLQDIYIGSGLEKLPRGTIKKLRVFTYNFSYYGMAGVKDSVGMDGPWDIHQILGTVPVAPDGSAYFIVPANTPIALQPLDSEGKAVQLMRSWFTAMPGESVSCIGCHEPPNGTPAGATRVARDPVPITPWRGPARGFSWEREVQPVLDKYCVGCHNGQPRPGGAPIADLRGAKPKVMPNTWYAFPPSYYALWRHVRKPGLEGPSIVPLADYHADVSPLVRMLRKRHHNVQLDEEAWDRLVTWIDLNAPAYGSWLEMPGAVSHFQEIQQVYKRRMEMMRLYGGSTLDPEAFPVVTNAPIIAQMPAPEPPPVSVAKPAGWPFDAAEAHSRQTVSGTSPRRVIELGDGVRMELVPIPAGEFILGDPAGSHDERPVSVVKIARPFWMATCEVSNEQYKRFDPLHDSGLEITLGMKWSADFFLKLNEPKQPVCRVSWCEAFAFCEWLSKKTGKRFTLPDEAQWEWACRAGSDTAWNFGTSTTNFPAFANLADSKLLELGKKPKPENASPFFATESGNDQHVISSPVGSYLPNPWGLYDMHGNVAEWTGSTELPYPFNATDPCHAATDTRKIVRGGSWRETARWARSGCRGSYPPWQGVFNVGFRVIVEE